MFFTQSLALTSVQFPSRPLSTPGPHPTLAGFRTPTRNRNAQVKPEACNAKAAEPGAHTDLLPPPEAAPVSRSPAPAGTRARLHLDPRAVSSLLPFPLLTPQLSRDKLRHIKHFKSLFEALLPWPDWRCKEALIGDWSKVRKWLATVGSLVGCLWLVLLRVLIS